MGVTDCDNMLMLLGVSTKMTEKERDVVIPLMMRGFKVCHSTPSLLLLYCIHVVWFLNRLSYNNRFVLQGNVFLQFWHVTHL